MVEPFQLILINFCIYSKEQIFKLCGLTDKVGYLPDGIAHTYITDIHKMWGPPIKPNFRPTLV